MLVDSMKEHWPDLREAGIRDEPPEPLCILAPIKQESEVGNKARALLGMRLLLGLFVDTSAILNELPTFSVRDSNL